jgi:hypothetical protein
MRTQFLKGYLLNTLDRCVCERRNKRTGIERKVTKGIKQEPDMGVHSCNPSYVGGRGWEEQPRQ